LGPVSARSFAPAPGWSADGHRIKAPLEYGRGLDKTWVYEALCVRDGQALTLSAPSRNTAGYLSLLQAIEHTYPCGKLTLISDNREQPQEPAHPDVVGRTPAHPTAIHSESRPLGLI
jgi:hypothetical protein